MITTVYGASLNGVYLYSSGMYSSDNYILTWNTRKEVQDYLHMYYRENESKYKIKPFKVNK
jgi:hypothetical protein